MMKRSAAIWLALAALFASHVARAEDDGRDGPLYAQLLQLDQAVFDAYNRCDLDTFAGYFAPDVEFYHDTGGVTHDRQTVIDNTRKWICHKVRRELIADSFRAYPLKDYGALAEGEHRFCELASGQCEGVAKFVIVWQHVGDQWRITRVLSYGHRSLATP